MPEIQRTLPLDPGRDLLRLDFWRSSPRGALCPHGAMTDRRESLSIGSVRAAGCRAIAGAANMPPLSITKEQLTRALGQAVIRIWSNLPQDVQDHLFKEAVHLKVSPLISACRFPA